MAISGSSSMIATVDGDLRGDLAAGRLDQQR